MFAGHLKSIPHIRSACPALQRLIRTSGLWAAPDCPSIRTREETLTGVLIILSILALLLTF